MERTGIMRGKENMEQQLQLENGRMWDHASKLREARDARRKRILARSSERLAFITGEANAIPTSPLLDKSNLFNQEISHYNSPDQESTMKKSLFPDYDQEGKQREAQKKIANNRENTSKAGAAIAQPSENTEPVEASKEQAHECMKENPITFKNKFSYCIRQTLFPRRISATCIALAFLASGFTQGGQLGGASLTFGFAHSGHLGQPDAFFMINSLAIVMVVDLVLLMGAFFFFLGIEHLRDRKAMAKKGSLSMLLHLLLSISLDCSVCASLLSGGFLVFSKYFPSHISGVA